MPLPVIAGTFRITLNWNALQGVKPANVFHVQSGAGNASDVSTALSATLTSAMFTPMNTSYQIQSFEVLPLDGTSATHFGAPLTAVTGGQTGEFSPASAVLVSFYTLQRGPAHRGRIYIGPCAEAMIASGVIGASPANALTVAWAAFDTALQARTPSVNLCVASYAHSSQLPVANIQCKTVLGTQRRRQDQLT